MGSQKAVKKIEVVRMTDFAIDGHPLPVEFLFLVGIVRDMLETGEIE